MAHGGRKVAGRRLTRPVPRLAEYAAVEVAEILTVAPPALKPSEVPVALAL